MISAACPATWPPSRKTGKDWKRASPPLTSKAVKRPSPSSVPTSRRPRRPRMETEATACLPADSGRYLSRPAPFGLCGGIQHPQLHPRRSPRHHLPRPLATEPRRDAPRRAQLPAGSDEYKEVFEIAVRMYPDDPVSNLNAANIALQNRQADKARRYLAKAAPSPQKELAEADPPHARRTVGRSRNGPQPPCRKAGSAEAAAANLEMVKQMKE